MTLKPLHDLIAANSRVSAPETVHDYGCPVTRLGRRYGPCNCPAGPAQVQLNAALRAAGLSAWVRHEDMPINERVKNRA